MNTLYNHPDPVTTGRLFGKRLFIEMPQVKVQLDWIEVLSRWPETMWGDTVYVDNPVYPPDRETILVTPGGYHVRTDQIEFVRAMVAQNK